MKAPKQAEIKRVREDLGMSQAEFAKAFHLNKRTLENWEQGEVTPEGPSRVLLWLICHAPQSILRLLKGSD